MTRNIHLGTFRGADAFNADLDIVLRSNVLAQANSGGGKSWLLRRFAEQAFAKVPQIIIDPEGEFSTLREQFDFVLVGKGGDTPADIRSAPLLAHRLLELGASAIVDLFEMSKTQRPAWVAAFVQALVDAPKKLWRDLIVHIDESHEFAPEPGHGVHESGSEKLCRSALIDLAAKGRKRGYGVCAYTQRLGKLSKDFAAELKNVLIGQTFIDIDRERAAGNLGIAKGDKLTFFRDVKNLPPGSFYALGRAFVLEPTLVKIGTVTTEHPTPGKRQAAPPPPTAKIKHMLPQLADLPAEAEQKLRTEAELKARIVELERELARKPTGAPAKSIEKPVLKEADYKRLEKLVDKLAAVEDVFGEKLKEGKEKVERMIDVLAQSQQAVVLDMFNLRTVLGRAVAQPVSTAAAPQGHRPVILAQRPAVTPAVATGKISAYAHELLKVVVSRGSASDAQISTLSGYRRTSSGFGKALAELNNAGLIGGPSTARYPTEAARALVGDVAPPPTGPALLDYWCSRLTKSEANVLRVVYGAEVVSYEQISAKTGYSMTSSGFGKALGGLRKLGLIHNTTSDHVSISDSFS